MNSNTVDSPERSKAMRTQQNGPTLRRYTRTYMCLYIFLNIHRDLLRKSDRCKSGEGKKEKRMKQNERTKSTEALVERIYTRVLARSVR